MQRGDLVWDGKGTIRGVACILYGYIRHAKEFERA
jgi:hypothetical protein